MKAFAPGKLVLTGAYAVLEGAPSIVVATSRGVVADGARRASFVGPEVRAALGDAPAPAVDPSALFEGDRKLGLGASAAILVATLAVRAAEAGAELGDPKTREALFTRARRAHARAQGGGSGVDVAASVHGGVVRYVLEDPRPARLPAGLVLTVYAARTSARTPDLRARVDAAAATDAVAHRACMDALVESAHVADRAVASGDGVALVEAIRVTARRLATLGALAGVPIVPAGAEELEAAAREARAAFCVAGAGGGDVAFHLGPSLPSPELDHRAAVLGLQRLDLDLDQKGTRLVTTPEVHLGAVEASST